MTQRRLLDRLLEPVKSWRGKDTMQVAGLIKHEWDETIPPMRPSEILVDSIGIGAGGPQEYVNIAKVPAEKVYEHCRGAWQPGADGMIVSCTDFRTLDAVPRLERELGKPVVSSNLATLWLALQAAGVRERPRGFGRLMEQDR